MLTSLARLEWVKGLNIKTHKCRIVIWLATRCSGLQTLHQSVLSMLETSEMVQYIGRGWGVCVFIKNSSIYKHQCFSDLMEMQHIMCIVLRGEGEWDLSNPQIYQMLGNLTFSLEGNNLVTSCVYNC